MTEYEQYKHDEKIEQNAATMMCMFPEPFKRNNISRMMYEGLQSCYWTAAKIALNLSAKGYPTLTEDRYPVLRWRTEYKRKHFTLVTYVYDERCMFEAGLIYNCEDGNKRSFNGTADEIVSHIKDIASGKEFSDDPVYIDEPYTSFLSTQENVLGLNGHINHATLLKYPDVRGFAEEISGGDPEESLVDFIQYLWSRSYFVLMKSHMRKKNGYMFTFGSAGNTVVVSFNPDDPGESGVKSEVSYRDGTDGEMFIVTVDSRRDLEFLINDKTGISSAPKEK